MKPVVHVITTIERGGAENQLLILVESQVSSGRKVSILPLKGKPELHQKFREVGADVLLEFNSLSFLRQILLFRKKLKSLDAVFHSHLPRAELLTFLGNPQGRRINTRHNSEPFFPSAPKAFSNLLSRAATSKTNCVVAISEAVEDYVRSRGELRDSLMVAVVHYGFPALSNQLEVARADKTRYELQLKPSEFVVGAVGRLVAQKDYVTLLLGFATAAKRNPNMRLVVLGEGPLKSDLLSLAHSLNVSEKVIWLGKVDNVSRYMSIMDIFVLPSIYEGFGLVLLEAMGCNIPIIASSIPTSVEVLGKDHGYFFTPRRSGELADLIEKLMDSALREELVIGQSRRMEVFTVQKMREKLDAIYQD